MPQEKKAKNMLSHPHICGIGGIGTSGVALLLRDLGIPVTGSDLRPSELTQMLNLRDVYITYQPNPGLATSASCVIVPAVFPQNHPEVEAARAHSIPVIGRTEALAWICQHYVENLTLVLGTQERASVARAIAESEHCGYCTGMASRDGAPHAKFASNLVLDLDERSFYHHPELYKAFTNSRVLISDWAEKSFGYYPDDFSRDIFCANIRPYVRSVECLSSPHPWSSHAPQGIGWFECIAKGRYHEIRMHPVNVASALQKLRHLAHHAPVFAVMRPFISTIRHYDTAIWSQVLSLADRICIISPPYEGCTHQECVEFVQKLCDSGCPVCVCTHSDAREAAGSESFSLWIGAPDIISVL